VAIFVVEGVLHVVSGRRGCHVPIVGVEWDCRTPSRLASGSRSRPAATTPRRWRCTDENGLVGVSPPQAKSINLNSDHLILPHLVIRVDPAEAPLRVTLTPGQESTIEIPVESTGPIVGCRYQDQVLSRTGHWRRETIWGGGSMYVWVPEGPPLFTIEDRSYS
jgi:hypothetical protein